MVSGDIHNPDMSLLAALTTILVKLEKDEFANEQAIKQGVVLRILISLGWDTFDTTIVSPEYSVPPRRVDYARLRDKSDYSL